MSLVLFLPDNTVSNLAPDDPGYPNYPPAVHGRIKLGALFHTPAPEECARHGRS
jgi:hypothetical protein